MFGKASKKVMVLGVLATMTASLMVGCGSTSSSQSATTSSGSTTGTATQTDTLSGKITASGSTALLPLVKQAADDFQNAHANVTVDVSGGGSGTGQKQVAEGSVDIGDSDVPADAQYNSAGLVDNKVCVAPFILITNTDVGVTGLTKQQASDIFTGKITNWKQVGGKDENITIIGRAESSGSRKYITSAVLDGKEFVKSALVQDSTGSLKTAVAQTPGAIGYIDAAYADSSVTSLQYAGVAYSPDSVENGQYKLWTYEHMMTKGQPNAQVKAFLDFIMSKDFQDKYVQQMHYLPLSAMKVTQ